MVQERIGEMIGKGIAARAIEFFDRYWLIAAALVFMGLALAFAGGWA